MKKVTTEVQLMYPSRLEGEYVGDDIFGLYLHDSRRKGRLEKEELNLLSKTVHYGIEARAMLEDGSTRSAAENEMLMAAEYAGLQARNRIVETNTGLVHAWANRHQGRGVPFQDLIQVGNLGLIHAAEKFDPDLGYTFGTYATRWIRSYIEKAVHQRGRMIAVPVEDSQSLQKIRRIVQDFELATGSEPSIEELAKEANYTLDKVKRLLSMEKTVYSLNYVNDESDVLDEKDELQTRILPERHVVPEDEAVIDSIMDQSAKIAINIFLSKTKLNEPELEIVRMHFGIGYDDPMKDIDIAKSIGRSRNVVARMFKKAMQQLEIEAREANLSAFIDL